jgi:putative hemolysin
MSLKQFFTILTAMMALLTAGCGATGLPTPVVTTPDGSQALPGVANPASEYCVAQGGRLEMRIDPAGNEAGVCIFPDGSECEEWAYYRGECQPASASADPSAYPVPVPPPAAPAGAYPGDDSVQIANPASVHCMQQGGVLQIRTDEAGNQVGYCLFDDGSECEEWAFFREECVPLPPPTSEGIYLESVEVRLAESFPVQVSAVLRGNFADGCTSLAGVDVTREGDTFHIVLRSRIQQGVMCTMALVPFEEIVVLESAGLPPATYTVTSHGQTTTFDLQ